MIRKAVIPAAGVGSRWLPASRCVPKELFPVGYVPVMAQVVDEAFDAGVSEVIIVTSPMKPLIEEYFDGDPHITFVYQLEPRGLGDAVLRCADVLRGEAFAVLLPDVLVSAPFFRDMIATPSEFHLMVNRVPPAMVDRYGIVRLRHEGVVGAVEKPSPADAPSRFALSGRYVLPPRTLEILERIGREKGAASELTLTEAIDVLARETPADFFGVEGGVVDVGTPEGMASAWKLWNDQRKELYHEQDEEKG